MTTVYRVRAECRTNTPLPYRPAWPDWAAEHSDGRMTLLYADGRAPLTYSSRPSALEAAKIHGALDLELHPSP